MHFPDKGIGEVRVAAELDVMRLHRKAVGLRAEGRVEPEITADAVTWAANFVAYATKQMLARSALYVNKGSFGRLKTSSTRSSRVN